MAEQMKATGVHLAGHTLVHPLISAMPIAHFTFLPGNL